MFMFMSEPTREGFYRRMKTTLNKFEHAEKAWFELPPPFWGGQHPKLASPQIKFHIAYIVGGTTHYWGDHHITYVGG